MKTKNRQQRLANRRAALEAFKKDPKTTGKADQRLKSGGYRVPGSLNK